MLHPLGRGERVDVEEFIAKWENCSGSERANYAVFLTELTQVLGVDAPGPSPDYRMDAPVPGGAEAGGTGFIDLYKRGCFVLEAKQSKVCELPSLPGLDDVPVAQSGAKYDELMRRAFRQARRYAQSLTQPPGRRSSLSSMSAGHSKSTSISAATAATIVSSRIACRTECRSPRCAIRRSSTACARSGPTRNRSIRDRKVAKRLASVSKYIEDGLKPKLTGKSPREKSEEIEEAALFLMRILFCMFAEDVGLLPTDKFSEFLRQAEANDQYFAQGLADLWQKMGAPNIDPRFSLALASEVKYFNGGLFESNRTFPLHSFVIHDLYEAARQNWRKVEPAIFGTLLEQALSSEERAKLGAHYTPRPYVETLVRATIMDVLEAEWAQLEEEIAFLQSSPERGGGPAAQPTVEGAPASARPVSEHESPRSTAGPLRHPSDGPPPRSGEDLALATRFHHRLATIRVLDPACGTGNFLYVSMELMQALEARVIETIQKLGGHADPKVGPHQFYGLEKNPRAAKIAELVLWIGWLRNRLHDDPDSVPQPVLAESANINFGRHGGYDAVLKLNELGQPDLDNPMIPEWPQAEFIVGNPPFIGGKDLRDRLGSDYAEALWKANPRVPKSSDFVMQWWDRAAHTLVAEKSPLIRFGFVTTNSITQEFSRRVIANYLSSSPERGGGPSAEEQMVEGAPTSGPLTSEEQPPRSSVGPLHHAAARRGPPPRSGEDRLSLVMAIPDHPWTKATKDAAAVRIAMTVAERGEHDGELREVTSEIGLATDEPRIELARTRARINADLSTGADVSSVVALRANEGLASPGVKLHGAGFIISPSQARDLGLGTREGLDRHIRPYVNGRDLLQHSRGVMVIDLQGLTERTVRERFPEVYQHVLLTVKPERDSNREQYRRENWWVFGRKHTELRSFLAGLPRFLATVETSKHRIFQFIPEGVRPDNMITAIGSDDPFHLGVL